MMTAVEEGVKECIPTNKIKKKQTPWEDETIHQKRETLSKAYKDYAQSRLMQESRLWKPQSKLFKMPTQ